MSRLIIFILGIFLSLQVFSAIVLDPTLDGIHQERWNRYLSVAQEAEIIVNSEQFKNQIISRKFSSTKLSGLEVYQKMVEASEILHPLKDGIWEWKVGFYYKRWSKVIGWTNAQIDTVWVNTYKFDVYSKCEIMANVVHEYMHKIKFNHSSAKDYNSVPYAAGYIARDICENKSPEIPNPIIKKSWWSRLISIFR